MKFKELDVVTLVADMPEIGVVAGEPGTVLMVHEKPEAYDVEFVRASEHEDDVWTVLPPEKLQFVEAKRESLETA